MSTCPVFPGDRIELEYSWLPQFRIREGTTGTVTDFHEINLSREAYGSGSEPIQLTVTYWHVSVEWDSYDGLPELDLLLPQDAIAFVPDL